MMEIKRVRRRCASRCMSLQVGREGGSHSLLSTELG
jgi:hypothetical protein